MKIYVTIKNDQQRHFDEESAKAAVEKIYYTDKAGEKHIGAHWTKEEIEALTKDKTYKDCVTIWDKYVAFNIAYSDLIRIMSADMVILTAQEFFFNDDDAPCNKVWVYVHGLFRNR